MEPKPEQGAVAQEQCIFNGAGAMQLFGEYLRLRCISYDAMLLY